MGGDELYHVNYDLMEKHGGAAVSASRNLALRADFVRLFRRIEQFVGRQMIEPAPASTAHHDADPDPRIDTCLLRRVDQGLSLLSLADPVDEIHRGHHRGRDRKNHANQRNRVDFRVHFKHSDSQSQTQDWVIWSRDRLRIYESSARTLEKSVGWLRSERQASSRRSVIRKSLEFKPVRGWIN
jgi:hypothetical protein